MTKLQEGVMLPLVGVHVHIHVCTSPSWLGGCTQLCRYVAVVSAE